MVKGALEILKDALCGREKGLTRVVHVNAYFLDHVGNVGPTEGEVLESPSQVAIGGRRRPWPECQPVWSRACSCSCQHTQGCPVHTSASGGRGRRTAALLINCCWRVVVVRRRSSLFEAVRMMSLM
jgi:hypothetical protein